MKHVSIFIVIGIIASNTLSTYASNTEFFYMSFEPVRVAMGEGISTIYQGTRSSTINPATAALTREKHVHAAHVFLSLDRRISCFGASIPVGNRASLAVSGVQTAITEIDGRDTNGRHTEFLSDEINMVSFIFAFRPSSRVAAGMAVKPLFRTTGGEDASGVAFDIGTHILLPYDLHASVSGRNLGITQPQDRSMGAYWSWNTDYWGDDLQIQKDDRVPPALSAGIGCSTLPLGIKAVIGILTVEGETVEFSGGIEIPVDERMGLRAGGSLDNPGIGCRFLIPLEYANLELDYAYEEGEFTGDPIHRISVAALF